MKTNVNLLYHSRLLWALSISNFGYHYIIRPWRKYLIKVETKMFWGNHFHKRVFYYLESLHTACISTIYLTANIGSSLLSVYLLRRVLTEAQINVEQFVFDTEVELSQMHVPMFLANSGNLYPFLQQNSSIFL